MICENLELLQPKGAHTHQLHQSSSSSRPLQKLNTTTSIVSVGQEVSESLNNPMHCTTAVTQEETHFLHV